MPRRREFSPKFAARETCAFHSRQHRLCFRWRKAGALYRGRSGRCDQRLRRIEASRRTPGARGERSRPRRSRFVGLRPDRPSFVDAIFKRARTEENVAAVADKFSTPTYTHDIAELLRPFFERETAAGVLHLANRGACSWQEYAQWALDCCHRSGFPMRATTVGALSLAEMKSFVARRPVYTVFATEKYERLTGRAPRDWHDAVAEYVRKRSLQIRLG